MTQVFIVSGTSWTVPADWNSADNIVETIGAGGGGQTANSSYAGSGGGGGAYSKITNLSLTAGNAVTIQVGAGGSAGSVGANTWFNGTSVITSSVGATGGGGGANNSGGAGGAAASGVGTIRYSGGSGGTDNSNPFGGGGGGGAAGPNGAGSVGAGSTADTFGGGGGGGNGGGSSTGGGAGDIVGTGDGGNGGTAEDGTSGGTGAIAADEPAAGGNGSHGSGGGGGARDFDGVQHSAGGNGGAGTEWDASHGSGGGGGGGGGGGNGSGGDGGAGGTYGGGGGGGGYAGGSLGSGGTGGGGIVVITYTPAAAAAITAESWTASEVQGAVRADQPPSVECCLIVPRDCLPLTEVGGGIWRADAPPINFPCVAAKDVGLPTEWAGDVGVTADTLAQLDAVAWSFVDAAVPLELASRTLQDVTGFSELSATHAVDAQPVVEFPCTAAGEARPLGLEWADPPGLLLVSSERLLRSPGRIRILAGPSSMHPLRGS